MNKTEFMRQLEVLLQSIPETERREALQYYNDYFDDAGVENEKEVLDALGNPAKVAENIKRDLYGDDVVQSSTIKDPPVKYQESAGQKQDSARTGEKKNFFARMGAKFDSLPTWGQALVIVACIFLAPAIFSAASAVLGVLVGLVASWFSLILGFGVTAIVLIIILFFLVIAGIMLLVEAPFGGIAMMGAGLLCGGLGILFLMLTVAMAGIATPAIFKGIAALCGSLFGKKEVAA